MEGSVKPEHSKISRSDFSDSLSERPVRRRDRRLHADYFFACAPPSTTAR